MSSLKTGIVGFVALTLVGCQFGNRSSTELRGYDTISGYYSSLPQTLKFQAQVGSGPERVQNSPVNLMPPYLKAVLANPTMLYYDSPTEGIGSLRAHDDTDLGFPTRITDSSSTFGASTSASAVVSGCRLLEETVHSGRFSQNPTTSTLSGYSVRGKISLAYSIRYSFIGDDIDCNAMRTEMQSCYVDNVGCATDSSSIFSKSFITQVFGPHISAGVMIDTEISTTKSIGYEATYE